MQSLILPWCSKRAKVISQHSIERPDLSSRIFLTNQIKVWCTNGRHSELPVASWFIQVFVRSHSLFRTRSSYRTWFETDRGHYNSEIFREPCIFISKVTHYFFIYFAESFFPGMNHFQSEWPSQLRKKKTQLWIPPCWRLKKNLI